MATSSDGGLSILTSAHHFQCTTQFLKQHLCTWASHHCKEQNLDLTHLLPCELAFQNCPYDEDSDATFHTYLLACSYVYTVYDGTPHTPPIDSTPSTQVWDDPNTIRTTINPSTSILSSGITLDDFDKVTQENAKLVQEVK